MSLARVQRQSAEMVLSVASDRGTVHLFSIVPPKDLVVGLDTNNKFTNVKSKLSSMFYGSAQACEYSFG